MSTKYYEVRLLLSYYPNITKEKNYKVFISLHPKQRDCVGEGWLSGYCARLRITWSGHCFVFLDSRSDNQGT